MKSNQLSFSHPYWRTLEASIFYPFGCGLSNSSHSPWTEGAWCVPNVLRDICECYSGLLVRTQLSRTPACSLYKLVSVQTFFHHSRNWRTLPYQIQELLDIVEEWKPCCKWMGCSTDKLSPESSPHIMISEKSEALVWISSWAKYLSY